LALGTCIKHHIIHSRGESRPACWFKEEPAFRSGTGEMNTIAADGIYDQQSPSDLQAIKGNDASSAEVYIGETLKIQISLGIRFTEATEVQRVEREDLSSSAR
jgi:hypothetical protein